MGGMASRPLLISAISIHTAGSVERMRGSNPVDHLALVILADGLVIALGDGVDGIGESDGGATLLQIGEGGRVPE